MNVLDLVTSVSAGAGSSMRVWLDLRTKTSEAPIFNWVSFLQRCFFAFNW